MHLQQFLHPLAAALAVSLSGHPM
jgi:hypothetical protein